MNGDDGSYTPAEASHQALRGIQRELERHPAIDYVRGFPSGEHTQVVAHVATDRVGMDAEDATLTVSWFAGETAASRPEFSFHYSDSTGDFGWQHHPQEHVAGWGHFQERSVSETTYSYDPYTFASTNPTRVVWEVVSLLTSRLQSE